MVQSILNLLNYPCLKSIDQSVATAFLGIDLIGSFVCNKVVIYLHCIPLQLALTLLTSITRVDNTRLGQVRVFRVFRFFRVSVFPCFHVSVFSRLINGLVQDYVIVYLLLL